MKHRFVLLLAVLGFGTLVCALLFSRDNKLQYQTRSQGDATGLAPSIETLAEAPAPAAAAEAPKPEAAKQQALPKTTAAKAKS
jgi:hypothetical protein